MWGGTDERKAIAAIQASIDEGVTLIDAGLPGHWSDLLAALAAHELDLVIADAPPGPATPVRVYTHPLGDSDVTVFGAPALAAAHRRRFPQSLDGAPFHGSNALVVPVQRGPKPLALRLAPPDARFTAEVHALRFWDGRGVVQLIDDDVVAGIVLLERLDGARTLETVPLAEAIPVIGRLARELAPNVILLDFVMPGMSAFEVLDELKADPRTRDIPVIIHTSKDLAGEERERLRQAAAAAILNKQSLSREVAIARIRDALSKAGVGMAVKVDDGRSHG